MKATEFKSVLSDLADLFRAGTAKTPAKDLDLLAGRIDTSGNKSADAALDDLERELTATPPPTDLSPQDYIQAFTDAGLDEAAFQKLFQKFKTDKSIKKADAIEVMKGYAGAYKRARAKARAIEEVERRFTQLVYDDHSHREAASTTPW